MFMSFIIFNEISCPCACLNDNHLAFVFWFWLISSHHICFSFVVLFVSYVQLSLRFYLFIDLLVSSFFAISSSLNPVELIFPASPSPLCLLGFFSAEHMWHPPESLGQSRIHAEHVTSSPDFRQLWGICLLMMQRRGWGTFRDLTANCEIICAFNR